MESKSIAECLAFFLNEMAYEDLPTTVVEKAKQCILDLFGAHFAGFDIDSCQTVKDYISTFHGSPQATIWSLGTRTLATEAAFVNGAVAHSTVFDDMHANSVSHFGSVIIPAALAVAEDKRFSGRDLILAIVCGYEVAIRVGTAMLTPEFFRSGFRPSGIFGVFGSTVAAVKLLGLNHEQIINGLREEV